MITYWPLGPYLEVPLLYAGSWLRGADYAAGVVVRRAGSLYASADSSPAGTDPLNGWPWVHYGGDRGDPGGPLNAIRAGHGHYVWGSGNAYDAPPTDYQYVTDSGRLFTPLAHIGSGGAAPVAGVNWRLLLDPVGPVGDDGPDGPSGKDYFFGLWVPYSTEPGDLVQWNGSLWLVLDYDSSPPPDDPDQSSGSYRLWIPGGDSPSRGPTTLRWREGTDPHNYYTKSDLISAQFGADHGYILLVAKHSGVLSASNPAPDWHYVDVTSFKIQLGDDGSPVLARTVQFFGASATFDGPSETVTVAQSEVETSYVEQEVGAFVPFSPSADTGPHYTAEGGDEPQVARSVTGLLIHRGSVGSDGTSGVSLALTEPTAFGPRFDAMLPVVSDFGPDCVKAVSTDDGTHIEADGSSSRIYDLNGLMYVPNFDTKLPTINWTGFFVTQNTFYPPTNDGSFSEVTEEWGWIFFDGPPLSNAGLSIYGWDDWPTLYPDTLASSRSVGYGSIKNTVEAVIAVRSKVSFHDADYTDPPQEQYRGRDYPIARLDPAAIEGTDYVFVNVDGHSSSGARIKPGGISLEGFGDPALDNHYVLIIGVAVQLPDGDMEYLTRAVTFAFNGFLV